MEPNRDTCKGPTASIWIDFHLMNGLIKKAPTPDEMVYFESIKGRNSRIRNLINPNYNLICPSWSSVNICSKFEKNLNPFSSCYLKT